MSLLKKLFFGILLLLVITIGGIFIFASTFDANQYKEQIISAVKKQTGRDLSIAGDLKLSVYPDIAIDLGKASFANAPGFSEQKFAVIESGKISVKLLPLLKKELKVDRIHLDSLKLNLHRKADGSTNWDDLIQSESKPAETKAESAITKSIQETINNLSIAGIVAKNTEIHWKDDQAKQDITLTSFNLETGTIKQGKPLPVDLSVILKQKNPAMTAAIEGSSIVSLNSDQSFSLANLKIKSKITGSQIPNGALDIDLAGSVSGSTTVITVPDLSVQTNLVGDLIPDGAVKTNLNGKVRFDLKTQQLSIGQLKIDSSVNGKPLAGGNLQALIAGDSTLNLKTMKLAIPNLAINAKLAGGHVKGGTATANISGNTQFDIAKQFLTISKLKLDSTANGDILKNGKANTQVTGDIQVNLKHSQIKSPHITINSHVEGGLIPGGKLTQQAQGNMDLNWANNEGAINLSSLLVSIAGLELKGSQVKLQPLATKPAVSGQFQTNTFNLKKVLKTLGIDLPVTNNPKALSKMQAQFALTADTNTADLKNLQLNLDASKVTGNLLVKNFATPSINTQLTIDKINADDYLAPTSEGKTSKKQTASTDKQGLFPLDVLRKLDMDGRFKIGSMVLNKLSLSNINAHMKAKKGLIIIDPANANLYKGTYKGRITLDATKTTPTMKMHHELVNLRSEGLLFDLFADRYISGSTKLVTDLSSRGNTIEALLKNLNGDTSIAFKDGSIRDSSLAEKVSLAVQAFEKKEIEDGKSVVKFTGLSGDWKTTNGVFATKNLSLLSPYFDVLGAGTADIANQKLDITLQIGPKSKKGEKGLAAPIRIYGSFDDLKYSLDMKAMLKALAQADIDKAKKQVQEKLKQAEKTAKAKLAAEKLKAEQRIKLQLKAKEEELKKKLSAKVGNDIADKLKQKLKGNVTGSTDSSTADTPKSVEDEVKDKLKNKLKSLF